MHSKKSLAAFAAWLDHLHPGSGAMISAYGDALEKKGTLDPTTIFTLISAVLGVINLFNPAANTNFLQQLEAILQKLFPNLPIPTPPAAAAA